MERIKFYLGNDEINANNICNIIEFINLFSNKINEVDINEILEYFNIIKFYDIGYIKNILITATHERVTDIIAAINKRIGKFIGDHKSSGFLNLYKVVDIYYKEDFWELIEKYGVFKNIDKSDLSSFLRNSNINYSIILKYSKIVKYFDEVLCEHMLHDSTSASVLLSKYFYQEGSEKKDIYLPMSLSEADKEKIILNYIESEHPDLNYLDMIIKFPSSRDMKIGDKIKLKAKRRYEEDMRKIIDCNIKIKSGVSIKYSDDQEEEVIYSKNGTEKECSVKLGWIKENLDFNTLLNNFIYIFKYFDMEMRLTLVSKINESGIFEKFGKINANHIYKNNSVFKQKDMMSTIQILSYTQVLSSFQIRLEELIEWFFNEYLLDEFGIKNYIVKMPTKDSSDYEKCRAVLPEIDSILKQYKLYLDDDEIDQELLQMSSSHMFFKECMSCVNKKYAYPLEGIFHKVSFLIFSFQSPIHYIPNMAEKYKNFYQLLSFERIKTSNFLAHQIDDINWLIENDFVCEDEDGFLGFINQGKITLFGDLYYNEVISYWHCDANLRDEIDDLVKKNVLKLDNKLFTKGEQDYFDYHLNKSKYSNSLDLRNRYLHGTQTNDPELHKTNYMIFLKLIIIIMCKINDDLCVREISCNESVSIKS